MKNTDTTNEHKFGRFSKRTTKIITALEEAVGPLTPEEVAIECGLTKEQARGALSDFANRPERYGVKIAGMKGKIRLYTMI